MAVSYQTGEALDVRTPKLTRIQQEGHIGLLFLSPWIIGFMLLKAVPILAAFVFGLTDFKMLAAEETSFVGLSHYIRFFGNEEARISLLGSFHYFPRTVPHEMIVALFLAAIFTSKRLKNKNILQTLIFLTSIITATSIFFIFLGALQYEARLIFTPLNLPPIEGFDLLVPLALWNIGADFLMMYSAMESLSKESYEAEIVNGTGPIVRFVYITLPMTLPAIFFALIIKLTGAFGIILLDPG